jgi:hypothetical protein
MTARFIVFQIFVHPVAFCKTQIHVKVVTEFVLSGGAVGWGTALQAGRSRVRFPIVSLEFFFDVILPVALCPWGWLSL